MANFGHFANLQIIQNVLIYHQKQETKHIMEGNEMTFKELKKLTDGKALPLMGENEDGEAVIVEAGEREGEMFFKTTTAQHNGWCRLNIFWEDGTTEELYKKANK